MVYIDVDKGTGAKEREHAREAKAARQHIAQYPLVAEQRGKVTQSGAQMERLTPFSRQRFADKQADHQRGQQGHQARIQKMACQLNQTNTAPPTIGATSGAMVVTSMTNDIMRENSSFG